MTWMIDYTIRVYPQGINELTKQTIPRLQPVGGGTVLQIFGYESDIQKIKMKVVGYEDHDLIKGLAIDGSQHYISDVDSGVVVSGMSFTKYGLFSSFTSNRNPTLYQTLRPDLDCDAPVFDVELEVFIE